MHHVPLTAALSWVAITIYHHRHSFKAAAVVLVNWLSSSPTISCISIISILLCKGKMTYLLTLQVSRYLILLLHGSIKYKWSRNSICFITLCCPRNAQHSIVIYVCTYHSNLSWWSVVEIIEQDATTRMGTGFGFYFICLCRLFSENQRRTPKLET